MNYYTNESRIYKIKRKQKICDETGRCTYCPIHRGENAVRYKHGPKKPRYKNKR